jgi:hypothetical protein
LLAQPSWWFLLLQLQKSLVTDMYGLMSHMLNSCLQRFRAGKPIARPIILEMSTATLLPLIIRRPQLVNLFFACTLTALKGLTMRKAMEKVGSHGEQTLAFVGSHLNDVQEGYGFSRCVYHLQVLFAAIARSVH